MSRIGNVVGALFDESTGDLQGLYSASGAELRLPREGLMANAFRLSHLFGRRLSGRMAAAAAAASDFTYHQTFTVEVAAKRFRFALYNLATGAVSISGGKFAVSNAMGADPTIGSTTGQARFTPSGAWTSITWNGATTVILPPRLSASLPSCTWSDWIDLATVLRTDALDTEGADLPVVMARFLVPSSGSTNPYSYGNYQMAAWWNAANSSVHHGRMMTSLRYTGDGLTTPANFQPTTNFLYPFLTHFEYEGAKPGITFGAVGDSITEGAVDTGGGTNFGNGWIWQAISMLRQQHPSTPIEFVNAGVTATGHATYFSQLIELMKSGAHFDVMIYSPFTPNDTPPSQASIDGQASKAAQAAGVVLNGNIPPQPQTDYTVTASPFTWRAPANGMLVLAGGTITSVTLARAGGAAVAVPSAGTLQVQTGDVIVSTYTVAHTTFAFFPASMAPIRRRQFVLTTPCPNTAAAWTAPQDAFRLLIKAEILAAKKAGALVIDLDAALSNGATPARFNTAHSTDGTHPNDTGAFVAARDKAVPVLRSLIPAI